MNFGAIVVEANELVSRIRRTEIGERVIDFFDQSNMSPTGNQQGSWFSSAWQGLKNGIGKFFEWLGGFDISEIGDWIIEGGYELAYFDWNISDEDIKEEIKQNNIQLAKQLGYLTGKGLVWLASFGVASLAAVKFPVLAGRVAFELAEEATNDLKASLLTATRSSLELIGKSALLSGYGWLRKLIKGKETKNEKPWIFAEKIEELVEKIDNDYLKGFVESALEGGVDALIDAIYVVTFTIDDHYTNSRVNQIEDGQPIRTVQVYPDADNDEFVLLEDSQENIELSINDYLATHSLVNNRDVGTVVGQPYDEWYTLTPQSRKLCIEFRSIEKPPFKDTNGKRAKEVQISIPNAKASINWNDLKAIKQFTWGNYMARGVFEDRRQMTVWGASESEAKSTLTAMAALSTKNLIQISVSHPEVQNAARKKKPTLVYPAYAVMLVRKTTTGAGDYTLIDGQNREMSRKRIEIWRDQKPDDFTGFN